MENSLLYGKGRKITFSKSNGLEIDNNFTKRRRDYLIKVKILFLLTGSGETVNTPNKSGIVHTIPLLFLYNGSDKTPCEKIIKLKSYDNHCYFSSLHFSRLGVSCECKI